MILGNAIKEINGLRHIAEGLELCSGLSRRVLMEAPFMSRRDEIEKELDLVEQTIKAFDDGDKAEALGSVRIKLEHVKDLRGTAVKLEAGHTLDDIELFELKVFAMTAVAIKQLLADGRIELIGIPCLSQVTALLDPGSTGVPHFAIYDSYSLELAAVRKKIKKVKQTPGADNELKELYDENQRLEDKVRRRLSGELTPFSAAVSQAMRAVARLDIILAKALSAMRTGLCKPTVADKETKYTGLFYPVLKEAMELEGKYFQPVDISFGQEPTLITGANMGGKTVLLKAAGLAQAMFQYGFYVPARTASVAVADSVIAIMGDGQDEMKGLSSFAAEMTRISRMTAKIRSGRKPLVLIDEPARTTNPREGGAIVNALLDFLKEHKVRSLVTSHYGGINAGIRKLRVKGLAGGIETKDISLSNLQEYMDYSLAEDTGEPPTDAIRISRILGVDEELLGRAEEYMNKKQGV